MLPYQIQTGVFVDRENWETNSDLFAFFVMRSNGNADWFMNVSFADDDAVFEDALEIKDAVRLMASALRHKHEQDGDEIFVQVAKDVDDVVQGELVLQCPECKGYHEDEDGEEIYGCNNPLDVAFKDKKKGKKKSK